MWTVLRCGLTANSSYFSLEHKCFQIALENGVLHRVKDNFYVFSINSCCKMVKQWPSIVICSPLFHKLVQDKLLDISFIMWVALWVKKWFNIQKRYYIYKFFNNTRTTDLLSIILCILTPAQLPNTLQLM